MAIFYKKNHVSFNLFFKQNAFKQTLEQLESAHKLLGQKEYEKFQSEILRILFFYVSNNFSIQMSDLSMENINDKLVANNIPKELIVEYLDLTQYLERCKYSPHQELEVNQDLYNRAIGIVEKINKII